MLALARIMSIGLGNVVRDVENVEGNAKREAAVNVRACSNQTSMSRILA